MTDPFFDWGDDRPPCRPWHETVIYEVQVKGFSRLQPDVPEELRGTCARLASDASLRYLTELGVTAVELLPIHYFLEDRHLIERGLSNYWGYNMLGFFAPTRKYCVSGTAADSVREFEAMVKALHAAGLDNASYYRLVVGDERHYMDYTGCGNTLNMLCPHVLQLACFYESLSRNPSFPPTFRLNHWSIALFGALGCLAIMFLTTPRWAAVALLLAAGLYTAIASAEILVQGADVDSGLAYQRARKALLRLEQEPYHPQNWRPTILALSGGAWTRPHLAHYARWLSAGYGIVSIGQLIRGDLEKLLDRRREAESLLRKFIREEELDAFPVVVVEEIA